MKAFFTLCVTLCLTLSAQFAVAQTDLHSLKSGFWKGAYRVSAQGEPSSCYLEAFQSSGKITVILLWNHVGLHIVLHNEKWSLVEGEEYQGRVVIDKRYVELVEAQNSSEQSIDYIFGYDENARRSIQAGNSIAMEGPAGKISFQLQGTRKAVDVIMACADKYFSTSQKPAPTNSPDINVGSEAFNEGDFTLALANWLPLAIQGDARAQAYLGEMYRDGDGVSEDFAEAARLFRLAADQGNLRAQSALGVLYYRGNGVPKNHNEAAYWFLQAAELGDASAQNYLAEMYRDGEGAEKDKAEAIRWFRKAASQGNSKAQSSLDALLALSEPVEVQSPPTPPVMIAAVPNVVPMQPFIEPDEAIEVQYSNLPAKGQDWLAISSPNHSPEQYFELVMLEGRPSEGTHEFKALPEGEYELRLYVDWPDGGYEIVATSKVVVALSPAPPLPVQPQPAQTSPAPAAPVPVPALPVAPLEGPVEEKPKAQVVEITGEWVVQTGMFKTIVFDQLMDLVDGISAEPEGQIEGEYSSGKLTGHWTSSDTSIGEHCDTERIGVSNWGLIEANLSDDGNSLSGAWSACDQFMTQSFEAARSGSAAALAATSTVEEQVVAPEVPAAAEIQTTRILEPVVEEAPKPAVGYSFDENGILHLSFDPLPSDAFTLHAAPKVQVPVAQELERYIPILGDIFLEFQPPMIAPKTPLGLGEGIPAWDSWPLVNTGNMTMEQVIAELKIEVIVSYDWLRTVYPDGWADGGPQPYAIDALAMREVYGGVENKTPPLTGWSSYENDRLTKYTDGYKAGVEFEFTDGRVSELRTIIEGGRYLEIKFFSGSIQVETVTNQNGWEIPDGKQFVYFLDGSPRCVRGRKGYPEKDMYRNHGRTACLDQNGYLVSERFYDDADDVGTWREYSGGWLKELSTYSQDRTDGIQARYSGGNLSYWGMYKDGRRNGPYIAYAIGQGGENHPSEKGTYVDGDKSDFLWGYQQGDLSFIKRMVKGLEVEQPITMEPDTRLIKRFEVYPDENQNGQILTFDYDGALDTFKTYDKNGTQGTVVEIKDGYLYSRTDYLDGKKHGQHVRYYTDAKDGGRPLERVETYKNGALKGRAIRFLYDGSVDYAEDN